MQKEKVTQTYILPLNGGFSVVIHGIPIGKIITMLRCFTTEAAKDKATWNMWATKKKHLVAWVIKGILLPSYIRIIKKTIIRNPINQPVFHGK